MSPSSFRLMRLRVAQRARKLATDAKVIAASKTDLSRKEQAASVGMSLSRYKTVLSRALAAQTDTIGSRINE
jgi:hypothetical protein